MSDDRLPPDDPLTASPTNLMGGRYRIDHVIGQGASGRVYLAFDTRLQHRVAIKELLATRHTTDPTAYQSFVTRFEREARAARWTQHPNIVTVYDLASDAAGNYY